jgi:hypothetical protein
MPVDLQIHQPIHSVSNLQNLIVNKPMPELAIFFIILNSLVCAKNRSGIFLNGAVF